MFLLAKYLYVPHLLVYKFNFVLPCIFWRKGWAQQKMIGIYHTLFKVKLGAVLGSWS